MVKEMEKGFAPVLILIIVGLLVGATLLVTQTEVLNFITKASPQSSVQVLPTPTPNLALNWKTYSNNKLGFQLKYPENWYTRDISAGDPLSLYLSPLIPNVPTLAPSFTQGPIVLKVTLKYPDYDLCALDGGPKCSRIVINGLEGQHYVLPAYSDVVVFERGENFYEFLNGRFAENDANTKTFIGTEAKQQAIFNQVLSSFKFTDQPQSTSIDNWKTYTNPTYKYSIQYPADFTVPSQTDKQKSQLGVDTNICIAERNIDRCIMAIDYYQMSLDEALKLRAPADGSKPLEHSTINIEGKKYVYKNGQGATEIIIFIPIPGDKGVISLSYTNLPSDLYETKLKEQILSTFKFTK